MIPVWLAAGHRVIAPDLIGFGKSDKPKRVSFHHFELHRNYLLEFIEHLDLDNIVLVVQDWGGILGLTLPMEAPQRYQGLVVMNTLLATGDTSLPEGFLSWREMCRKKPGFDIGRLFHRGNPQLEQSECDAYSAPFPDAGYRAALKAFPEMVPEQVNAPGAAIARRAREFLCNEWNGKTFMAIGALDPVLGLGVMADLRGVIRDCPEPMVLPEAGHFVPERGGQVASAVLEALAGR
jgi:tRNA(adenine34) deaminase